MQNFKMNKRAEHAALERLLNIYFREKGCSPKKEGTSQWHITLKDDLTLRGKLRYVSSMGHHMYDSAVYLESIGHVSQLTPLEAIRYILEAIAYDETSQTETTIVEAVYQDICNSISRTTRYLDQARRHAPPHQNHYIASEQSLYLGHPFHPTPKSATGFTDEDIEQYAPECGHRLGTRA
ncbi:IucA/IucC family protein [Staphylococcus pseudintermedius]|uniref:IucA/IucC family protein n=1 Tax=Staphylococcus pseudintermedius TaxID=283734 RepID=UPI00286E41B0|nr:IucA/IucC family protein [Staphylococcus pseudintermedius]WMZ63506.1 IucA/IucC family protein [Staphylococcus pseudintermedius]